MKFLPLFVFSFILLNCKPEKTTMQTMRSNIEAYLKSHGQVVSGYEFVAMTDIDTVTAKEYLDREIEVLSLALMYKEGRMKKMDSIEAVLKKTLSHNPNDQATIINLQNIATTKTVLLLKQHQLDSLTSANKPELAQMIKFIAVNFSFKSNDAAKARTLHQYYIKLDEELNVMNATELKNEG